MHRIDILQQLPKDTMYLPLLNVKFLLNLYVKSPENNPLPTIYQCIS